jgi:hypothetical protein
MQCLNQTILRLFYNTHLSESRGPQEKKEQNKYKKKKENRRSGYHHYSSLAPSGGLQAADGGTLDDRDSEAQRVRAQRASISSLVRLALYPDPSRSNSTSNSRKYDKAMVNAIWAPTGPC